MEKYSSVIARVLLAHIFIMAGMSKITAYAGTVGYMGMMGVPMPDLLLPLVIVLEVVGGLAVLVGWQSRYAAYALAAFSVVAAFIFHNNFSDQIQMIMFMKNMAIAGGLLLLAEHGPGAFSLGNRR